ncbi:hypothetical protein HAX54_050292, partial [Datura stramonium]|nr:hypothetical protein [Datura stramonium]
VAMDGVTSFHSSLSTVRTPVKCPMMKNVLFFPVCSRRIEGRSHHVLNDLLSFPW